LLPGIQELIDDFVESTRNTRGLKLVFLLGGAGNGKSFAARQLGDALGLVAEQSALARRIYETTRGSTGIELLNDATIAPSSSYGEHQNVALAVDIQRWWEQSAQHPVAAFCCVNRGIVVDEIRSLASHGPEVGPLARALLDWLASPTSDIASSLGAQPLQGLNVIADENYFQQQFEIGGRPIHVAALSVDSYSLLEPTAAGQLSRAGGLFQEIVARCKDEALSRPIECPIGANVLQLLSVGMVSKWEGLLASAEIASGRLHSYRDIWGLASLSILGPRFSAGSKILLEHVDSCLDRAKRAEAAAERLEPLLDLARFRLHNALFRSPIPTGKDALATYPPETPAHAGLSLVDPSAWGSVDSPAIESAMQVIALGGRPSSSLDSSMLAGSWSPFDELLEKTIVDYICTDSCPDNVRRRLISWLGGYLIRLAGVSRGTLGNSEVIGTWQKCHQACAKGPSLLPVELENSIRTLLFPGHDDAPRDRILVPAFAVRVEPLAASRDGLGPKLAELISHNGINIKVKRSGGRLLLECTRSGTGRAIGQLALDFPLLREALACRGNSAGQTESTTYVEPRIERCRASSLEAIPASERSLVAISGGRLEELSQ
jgi:hypothetical protein